MSDVEKLVYASIIFDSGIDKSLDYAVPCGLSAQAKIGTRVLAPIKGFERKGTIIALKDTPEVAKVQNIIEILSEKEVLSEDLFQLAKWLSTYYCSSLRKVILSMLPPSIRSGKKEKKQLFVKPLVSKNNLVEFCQNMRNSNASQAKVVDLLLKSPSGLLLSEILEKAQVSRSPIETLIKQKIISCTEVELDRSACFEMDYFKTKPKHLNTEQHQTLEKIKLSLNQAHFAAHLIRGVTGSGKTEVYLQALEHALQLEKGAIFLVPEISLTAQTVERLKGRFESKIAVLHHRLGEGEKRDIWHHLHQGKCKIVVGARSAIFSPVANLGLIIVDEEHESSYKQNDDMPCYHARDVAVMRAKISKSTVILGSATPCLESFYNAQNGKYILSTLSTRPSQALLPKVEIVDMRREFDKASGFTLFSETLLNGIKTRIRQGEQIILFLNRRGFHTSQICKQCAHIIQCPHCDVSLTFHLGERLLACHLCDYRLNPAPKVCPSCHHEDSLKFRGAGTEQVEKALHRIFPLIRTVRLDADTTRHKGSHDQLFKQFRAGKADVLIGTQMIAKGLHFPMVTLVGVLNADAGLQIPDFRAAENVFQMITQISGRSGRGSLPGEVVIQTRIPDQETILLAQTQDYEKFYEKEIEVRKIFGYPPFSHFTKCAFSGLGQEDTCNYALRFRQELIKNLPGDYEIHPVIPCGHAKIKDRYRFQFLIKGARSQSLSCAIAKTKHNIILPKNIKMLIDVDPTSTFF